MEYGVWKLKLGGKSVTLMGMFHPPISENNTNQAFFDEFIQVIGDIRTNHETLIIAGDLNIHMDNSDNYGANQFIDNLEALGLKNYVNFPTHISGHSLDLIICDCISNLRPIFIKPTVYLSDHCIVETLFNITHDKLPIREITYRKIKSVDPSLLVSEMNLDNITSDSLDDLLKQFNRNVILALDKNAPIKTVKVAVKDNKPWFNKDLRNKLQTVTLADLGGRCRHTRPPTGSISFIFAYIFARKCTRQRLAPHQWVSGSPNGKSWIRH